jgi:hypothetical protein
MLGTNMPEKKVAALSDEIGSPDLDAADDAVLRRPICGVVRPIADMSDYGAAHWIAVHSILEEAAAAVGYDIRIVSESDTAGIILNHIVTNLYSDPMVICDVSGRNPNVMFELGMRIAFERPVIVIADDTTPFSFDISPLKHFTYPRSLRYADMVKFKADIGTAIISTLAAFNEPTHRGYLQQFGPIEATKLPTQQISVEGMAADLAALRRSISAIEGAVRSQGARPASFYNVDTRMYDLTVEVVPSYRLQFITDMSDIGFLDIRPISTSGEDFERFGIDIPPKVSTEKLAQVLRRIGARGALGGIVPYSQRGVEIVNFVKHSK